ncbi:sugar 3,4-ketoisomerase [Actinomadura sediminis]|uniref:FdtA/QdtA family cupin domain-containing protein n=1 Tax=Actinomadura sediminis TaxID=1038904 RepID=A0ABW3EY97_9ACTN
MSSSALSSSALSSSAPSGASPAPSPSPPGGRAVGRTDPCRIVELPEYTDPRGTLTVVECGSEIDFDIKRAYHIRDVPDGRRRGAHGHRRLRQLIIAVHGSFEVIVDDGFERDRFLLDDPGRGLYVGPMIWRDMVGFAPGTVGLWLVSEPYDEAEYYRDYDAFLHDARAAS